MRRFFLLLLIIILLFAHPFRVFSQDRFATCDLCGYCPPTPPPGNWEKCRLCLYENASSDPQTGETLKIGPTSGLPPTPIPGRMYTMIGCIKTDLASFQDEGAAASLVKVLLDLVFSVIGGIALIYLIYGAFLILTSQAEPERLNYGKRVVYGAIIGVIFTISSIFFINILASGILKIPGFSSPP